MPDGVIHASRPQPREQHCSGPTRSRSQGRRSQALNQPADPSEPVFAARLRTLAAVPLLAPLPPADLQALARLAHEHNAVSGELLLRQGDPGGLLLIVLAGELRVSISGADGREQILGRLGPGDVVGEIAVLDGKPRSADVSAVTRARLLMVERRVILDEIVRSPDFALALLRLLCRKLRTTSAALEAMLFHGSETRLAAALLQLSSGRANGRVDVTQNELGQIVGVARETVNKTLRTWEKDGLVSLGRGRLVVRNAPRLAALLPDEGPMSSS